MAEQVNVDVTYRGPARLVGLLAQMIREEGASVTYEPPMEYKSADEVLRDVIVSLTCAGAYDAIRAGVRRYRAHKLGRETQVDLPGEPPDEDAD